MTRLVWDEIGKRTYETGADQGVLFTQNANGSYATGVAWNGLTNFTKSPTGGDASKHYANNKLYLVTRSLEEVEGSIAAYTYPSEFKGCLGKKELAKGIWASQQTRQAFGLAVRTQIGNDTEFENYGYKINLIYGATTSPSEEAHDTINDSSDVPTMTFNFTTTPVEVGMDGFKATSSLEISTEDFDAATIKKLEDIIYGTAEAEPRLPLPAEVITILSAA